MFPNKCTRSVLVGFVVTVGSSLAVATDAHSQQALSTSDKELLKHGGVAHILVEADIDASFEGILKGYQHLISVELRKAKILFEELTIKNERLQVNIKEPTQTKEAIKTLTKHFARISLIPNSKSTLEIKIEEHERTHIRELTLLSQISKMRTRIAHLYGNGVLPIVQRVGRSNRFVVQLPKGYDPDRQSSARHHFRYRKLSFQVLDERKITDRIIPPGSHLLEFKPRQVAVDGDRKVLVKKRIQLQLKDFRNIETKIGDTGKPEIHIKLNKTGMANISDIIGKKVAIVEDGLVISTPFIKGPFYDKTMILVGNFSLQEAHNLVNLILESIALTSRVEIRIWVAFPGLNGASIIGR